MLFGIREICDVVFKAKTEVTMGKLTFKPGQPVLYIDSAKTSTLEQASSTSYATGGKGNSRLITWEGEKTLTFTVEDALLSELGFAILSGAGLFEATKEKPVYVHTTAKGIVENIEGVVQINLADELKDNVIDTKSPVFVMTMEHGSFSGMLTNLEVNTDGKSIVGEGLVEGQEVFVDFYVKKESGATEMTIGAENFAGYYYVEASTLFRRQSDGKDLPAELVFPNVKVQSNFTFNMAATGDPSTFSFVMDAMPGYTIFDRKKKVLCAMNVVRENDASLGENKTEDSITNNDDIDG